MIFMTAVDKVVKKNQKYERIEPLIILYLKI